MNKGLGRGLSSLIPQKTNKTSEEETVVYDIEKKDSSEDGRILQLNPEIIKVNSEQPRQQFDEKSLEDLMTSIKEYGIIQPLVADYKNGEYELIAGERRLRASKALNLKTVPVIIRKTKQSEKLALALIENIQRENLNPVETALAYKKLLDEFNLTQDKLAQKIGKSRPQITNAIRLLSLPDDIQSALMQGKISEGHAKYLLGLESPVQQTNIFRKIMQNNWTVHDTNREIKKIGGTKKSRQQINYLDKDKEFALREFFGAKAEVIRKGRGGQIVIQFFSDDELMEIIKKVKK